LNCSIIQKLREPSGSAFNVERHSASSPVARKFATPRRRLAKSHMDISKHSFSKHTSARIVRPAARNVLQQNSCDQHRSETLRPTRANLGAY
jgi:hypothetical protein